MRPITVFIGSLLLFLSSNFLSATTYHNISCDGNITDWSATDEKIESRYSKDLYVTWSSTVIYFGWNSTNWSTDGDLLVYIDTNPATSNGTNRCINWNNEASSHTLSFYADYTLIIDSDTDKYFARYNGTTWSSTTTWPSTWSGYIYSGAGNTATEFGIVLSSIDVTIADPIRILIFAQNELNNGVWASFSVENSTGSAPQTFDHYYSIQNFTSGITPITTINNINCPNAVNNLSTLSGPVSGAIQLNWTAPGDDSGSGNITNGAYWVKYSSAGQITNWDSPPSPNYEIQSTTNMVVSSDQSLIVTGLSGQTTWYFAIKTRDEISTNWSPMSNLAYAGDGYMTLSLSKSSSTPAGSPYSGTMYPGEWIEYTLVVTNSGNFTATNVVLKDRIPSNATFRSNSYFTGRGIQLDGVNLTNTADSDEATYDNGTVTVNIGSVSGNSSRTVKFQVQIQ